jgi:hypothetical protein
LVAFYACQPAQQAYERRLVHDGRTIRAGQFSHFLLVGLSGEADQDQNGAVSRHELHRFVIERLDDTFNSRRPAADHQRPVLESEYPDRDWLKTAGEPRAGE